eukprot:5765733-Pleurochrysis_carterae.AAC.4
MQGKQYAEAGRQLARRNVLCNGSAGRTARDGAVQSCGEAAAPCNAQARPATRLLVAAFFSQRGRCDNGFRGILGVVGISSLMSELLINWRAGPFTETTPDLRSISDYLS